MWQLPPLIHSMLYQITSPGTKNDCNVESSSDRDVFTAMEGDRGESADENDVDNGTTLGQPWDRLAV